MLRLPALVLLAGVALGAGAQTRERALTIQPAVKAPEARHALVIGNSNYPNGPLRNPVNDARAMAKSLAAAGFHVRVVEDASHVGMQRAVRLWGNDIAKGGVGLFYYAGHGLQVKGRNYLVPVNAEIDQEDEIEFVTLDVNVVLAKIDTAKNALNIVILDACRNNPFARSFRSVSRGLAQMDAPTGTFIAFATAPGSVASDGAGQNGVYTEHLLKEMQRPGMPIEQMFKQVRIGVMNDTKNQQTPWESSSMRGDFSFLAAVPVPSQASVADAVAEALKRERESQQQAMERMIAAALEKQRAMLEAQGLKLQASPPPKPAGPDPREQELKAAAARAAADRLAAEKALAEAREAAKKAALETQKAAAERVAAQKAAADLAVAEKAAADRTAAARLAAERAAAERIAAQKAAAELKAATERAAADRTEAQRLAAQRAAADKAKAAQVQLASAAPVSMTSTTSGRLPQQGDTWTYRLTEPKRIDGPKERSYVVNVAAASGNGILEEYAMEGAKPQQWAHVPGHYLVGVGAAVFSPYLIAFEDLPARGSLGRIQIAEPACISSYACQSDGEVVGRESISVPAGKFEAIKVKIRQFWRTNYVSGYSSLQQNGGRDMFVWYVPELKRAVRFSSRLTYGEPMLGEATFDLDLVSYQLK